MAAYLEKRKTWCSDSPLIFSQRNRRAFSALTLSMLKEIYELAGIRTSSHSGRRTFATRLNAKGIGMKTIQRLMGHQHISATAVYRDVTDDMLREMFPSSLSRALLHTQITRSNNMSSSDRTPIVQIA